MPAWMRPKPLGYKVVETRQGWSVDGFFVPLGKGDAALVCGRESDCFAQCLNLPVNCLQDTSEILPNLDISKSQKLNPGRFNELLPSSVLLLVHQLKVTVDRQFQWRVSVPGSRSRPHRDRH